MHRFVTRLFGVAVLAVASAVAHGEIRTESVEYHDGSTVLKGYLAYDDASPDVRPGVLVCPEWWGLTEHPKHVAERLAKLGYVAFAADFYGNGKVTADPAEAAQLSGPFGTDRKLMRQRGRAALDTLMGHKLVDKSKVVAIGYCFGGAAALELARGGAPVAGVATFHGSLGRTADEGPDHIPAGCRVLVLHGGADPLVPPQQLAAFEQEMKQEKVDYQIDIFGGAKHAFTNPAADSYHMPQIGYDAAADRRSWAACQTFLAEVFKRA